MARKFKLMWESLREVVLEYLLGTEAETGASGPAEFVSNVPTPRSLGGLVSTIPGIAEVQENLRDRLKPGTCVALCGMPGSGKTYATYLFANSLREESPGLKKCLWTSAASIRSLRQGLAKLAHRQLLNLGGTHASKEFNAPDIAEHVVLKVLEHLTATGSWLLILDNMDGCFTAPSSSEYSFAQIRRQYFPKSGTGKILITTRDPAHYVQAQGVEAIEVPTLEPAAGAHFFLSRSGMPIQDETLELATNLSRALEGLALSLDSVASRFAEMRRRDPSFSLEQVLREINEPSTRFRGRSTPSASAAVYKHASVRETFQEQLELLTQLSAPAADLVRLCVCLAPEPMPPRLLQIYWDSTSPTNSDATSIEDALRLAVTLNLLKVSPLDGQYAVHREVRTVIREVLATEGSLDAWSRTARAVLDEAIQEIALIPRLHGHAQELAEDSLTPEFEHLAEYAESLQVLEALRDGDRWETLVFGDEPPTYERMRFALEDPAGRQRTLRRLAAIRSVCGDAQARLVFACVYFLVHYWWDALMEDDYVADALLELWVATHGEQHDAELVTNLRELQQAYPVLQHYRERPNKTAEWKTVARCLRRIRAILEIQDRAPADPAAHYVRAVTNIYLSESLQYGKEPQQALKLLAESEELFSSNRDAFHQNWATWEQASHIVETLALPGGGSRLALDREAAIRYGLDKTAQTLEHALERARDDKPDCELLANSFRVEAELTWQADGSLESCATGYWAATFLGLIFVLLDQDLYSACFYNEQRNRVMDWVRTLQARSLDEAVTGANLLRKCWGRRPLSKAAWQEILELGEEGDFIDRLSPEVPRLESSPAQDLSAETARGIREHIRKAPRRLRALSEFVTEPLQRTARLLQKQLGDEGDPT